MEKTVYYTGRKARQPEQLSPSIPSTPKPQASAHVRGLPMWGKLWVCLILLTFFLLPSPARALVQEGGACCLIDGTCVDVLSEDECRNLAGTYNGDGSSCVGGECNGSPIGACCLIDGSCAHKTLASCTNVGGEYGGDGSDCAETICEQPATGACCIDGTCEEMTLAECALSHGFYQADNTNCEEINCEGIGACCLIDGSCKNLVAELCEAFNGTFDGTQTCDTKECPMPTGACCKADGSCEDQVTAAACTAGGGIYQGDGTTCPPEGCPTGACCLNGGTCVVGTEALCAANDGVYQGDDTDCDPNPCPIPSTGACCLNNGTCVVGTQGFCEETNGIYQGDDTDCDPNPCPPSYDFGDAQHQTNNQYPTLLADNGARHVLGSGVYLGACVDGEADGQPDTNADDDDTNAGVPIFGDCVEADDEEGVIFPNTLNVGQTVQIAVTANDVCTLSAWIDFDADGQWEDPQEALFPGGQALTAGVNNLNFLIPNETAAGDTYARFRCTTDGPVGIAGPASDGEVEDYKITIDDDGDGVGYDEESGPNQDDTDYDGNNDGVADNVQHNVASLHTADGQNYVTLEASGGHQIENMTAVPNPSPADAPEGVTFPYGFFEFQVTGLAAGEAITVTLYLPTGETLTTYWKYGPTPNNPVPHWYEFMYDGQTGAVINGNVIVLHFVDGQRGDDDLTANGVVTDQGGPGFRVAPGGATPIPAFSTWGEIILVILLLGFSYAAIRKMKTT